MTHLQRLRGPPLLKWVSSNSVENFFKSLKTLGFCSSSSSSSSSRAVKAEENEINMKGRTMPNSVSATRISRCRRIRMQAQASLLEYLHCTRSLQFLDAEHMSKNSPMFLEKLLEKVGDGNEVGKSLARFLRYHPINEFEPFFESLGLNPLEFESLLPRDLMFLSDDNVLLMNYQVLCNYGIARGKIGKLFVEAMEIFRYGNGVLHSKLLAYEELGLSKTSVIKLVAACPSLLIGGVNVEFVKLLELLKCLGFDYNWIEKHMSEGKSYQWVHMLSLIRFFGEMGYSEEEIGTMIRTNPGLLLDGSGKQVYSLIGVLLKLGSDKNDISSLLPQIPQVQYEAFVNNVKRGFLFLVEIEMEAQEVKKIILTHLVLLGSCPLKKPNSVLTRLNVGKRRLCRIIREDPHQLKNWVLGLKINSLSTAEYDRKHKNEFLRKLGLVENSDEMEKALKDVRGRGGKLKERFDCFVVAGLDEKEVSKMVKLAPQVLNMSKDVIERKLDFLVNELGFPISSLVVFPSYVLYTIQRVKLRYSMYSWLKDEGVVAPTLALSTIIACSESIFVRQFVKHHPRGEEVWKSLKEKYSPR